MSTPRLLPLLLFLLLLASCAPAIQAVPTLQPTSLVAATLPLPTIAPTAVSPTDVASSPTASALPASTDTPTATPTPVFSPTADTRKTAKYWAEWPLIPSASARVKEIFLKGQALGNDPHSFSTIGDCQSQPNVFMGTYDTDSYVLGEDYASLVDTIQQFKGSFKRDSIAVKDGESVASVFSPAWADPKQCEKNETPLACEFRLHKPVIVFINLGTNWKGGDDVKHAEYMRKIVEFSIEHGVIPVISSKGDNLEGGHRINQSSAQVAYEYDIPFWNFWRSIRDLPGKGIDGTREGGYLTVEAWGRRSFSGLQTLDALWRELQPLVK